jgi:hypothetical protein
MPRVTPKQAVPTSKISITLVVQLLTSSLYRYYEVAMPCPARGEE